MHVMSIQVVGFMKIIACGPDEMELIIACPKCNAVNWIDEIECFQCGLTLIPSGRITNEL